MGRGGAAFICNVNNKQRRRAQSLMPSPWQWMQLLNLSLPSSSSNAFSGSVGRPSSKLEMWEQGAKNRSGYRSRRCWLAKPFRLFRNGVCGTLCFMAAAFCTPTGACDQPERTVNTGCKPLKDYRSNDSLCLTPLKLWLKCKLSHNSINL